MSSDRASTDSLNESVIARARVVLAELESERTVEELERAAGKRPRSTEPAPLPLFEAPPVSEHPLAGELRALSPDRMTPLEALQRLMEWKQRYNG